MRDTDESSILGRFWLPSADEATAIPGVLDFVAEGAIVRLDGALTPNGLLADATVFARLQGRHEVATLTNCYAAAVRRADGGVVSARLEATEVALGALRVDLGGQTVQFQLPGSEAWFHECTFAVEFGPSTGEVVVRFQPYTSTRYPLPGEMILERFYAATVPAGNWGTETFTVARPMAYRIHFPARVDFALMWEEMTRIRRFLEFFSQHHLPHARLEVFDARACADGPPDIEMRHATTRVVRSGKFQRDRQLVQSADIQDRFSDLLLRWCEVHRAHPEPFERYFAAFDRDSDDAVYHFLWNAAALEELHKLRTTRKQISLLERLRDIRSRWALALAVPPTDAVLDEIKNTRHYYAHAAGDLRGHAAKDWALLRHGHLLAALSNLEILALLGVPDAEVVQIARRYWMREALALRMFPDEGTGD